MDQNDMRPKRRQPRIRTISQAYLRRVARWYLDRYPASEQGVRRALDRRVRKHEVPDDAPVRQWIDEVVAELYDLGLLDERRYAHDAARSRLGRGWSARRMRAWLRQKGISAAVIDEVLGDDVARVERCAAAQFARRRRIGPFRLPEERQDRRTKDLAAFGRAGFPYGLARELVDLDSPEEVDDWAEAY